MSLDWCGTPSREGPAGSPCSSSSSSCSSTPVLLDTEMDRTQCTTPSTQTIPKCPPTPHKRVFSQLRLHIEEEEEDEDDDEEEEEEVKGKRGKGTVETITESGRIVTHPLHLESFDGQGTERNNKAVFSRASNLVPSLLFAGISPSATKRSHSPLTGRASEESNRTRKRSLKRWKSVHDLSFLSSQSDLKTPPLGWSHALQPHPDSVTSAGSSNPNHSMYTRSCNSSPMVSMVSGPINTFTFSPTHQKLLRRKSNRFLSDFSQVEEIGRGSYSTVFRAKKLIDEHTYAIKMSKEIRGPKHLHQLVGEVYALSHLCHPSIVRYYDAWIQDEMLFVVMEYFRHGSVGSLKSPEGEYTCIMSESTLCDFLRDMASALAYMHKSGFVHLDVKPDNVFMRDAEDILASPHEEVHRKSFDISDQRFVLGDLGLAQRYPISSADLEEGDGRYLAPELLNSEHFDVTKADIYSLGISMYELASHTAIKHTPGSPRHFPFLPHLSDELNRLIQSMVDPNPLHRPSANTIVSHPLLLSPVEKQLRHLQALVEGGYLAHTSSENHIQPPISTTVFESPPKLKRSLHTT